MQKVMEWPTGFEPAISVWKTEVLPITLRPQVELEVGLEPTTLALQMRRSAYLSYSSKLPQIPLRRRCSLAIFVVPRVAHGRSYWNAPDQEIHDTVISDGQNDRGKQEPQGKQGHSDAAKHTQNYLEPIGHLPITAYHAHYGSMLTMELPPETVGSSPFQRSYLILSTS